MEQRMARLVPPEFKIDGRQVITGVVPGSIAPYIVLAVRDPLGFTDDAAIGELSAVKCVADTGLFRTYTGTFEGLEVSVISTGSGGPEVEIAVVELAGAVDNPTIIRVGTSGSAAKVVDVGDLVISTAAVRSEGTSRQYVNIEYPAVATLEVVCALADAAHLCERAHHIGITRSTDSIYCGQGRAANGYAVPGQTEDVARWAEVGVLNFERETAALFTIGPLLGCRVGSLCCVVNSAVSGELNPGAGVTDAAATALRALVALKARDDTKAEDRGTCAPTMF